ncbi:hypothetical protein LTR78_009904 [Recurvomyces mirabilis]|uniref:Uncharacterized protein n=1 Tax=Recurvomyces mirabilis TaxID=574656 RepID=A0AAE0TNT4_9PEZI|nr:hypothetical protein LTR78_009904 [Recurvomyces mirabilis]KAK5150579.1 hypothetical protein LTS14_010073 [Recurvomyces mirabilis]
MACFNPTIVFALLQLLPRIDARLHRVIRQSGSQDIPTYLQQVNAARFDIAITQAGNESAVCRHLDQDTTYDDQPYDAALAEQLLYETASGIIIFPDLKGAAVNLTIAYEALQSARQGATTSSDCADLDVGSLEAAGLNGTAVQSIVCSAIRTTSTPELSTLSFTSISTGSTTGGSTSPLSSATTTSISLTTSAMSSSITSATMSSVITSTSSLTTSSATSTSDTALLSSTSRSALIIGTGSSTSDENPGTLPITTSKTTITPASSSASSLLTTSIPSDTKSSLGSSATSSLSANSTLSLSNNTTTAALGPSVIVGSPVSVNITRSASLLSASMTTPSDAIIYAGTITLLNTVWIFVDLANPTLGTTSTEFGSAGLPSVATGTGVCARGGGERL